MKKLALLLVPFFLFSCGEEEDDDTTTGDYRQSWAGSYYGTKRDVQYQQGQADQVTFEGQTTFTVTLVSDSFLSINGGTAFPIGTSGTYGQYAGGGGYSEVRFHASDSLSTTNTTGGLAGGTRSNFKGKKVS